MEIGDLVKMKASMGHWRGIGIVVGYADKSSHWAGCVQVDWIEHGYRKALHRIFDLEPVK